MIGMIEFVSATIVEWIMQREEEKRRKKESPITASTTQSNTQQG